MTHSPPTDHELLSAACSAAGLSASQVELLHHHATSVYLHRPAGAVIRVSRGTDRQTALNSLTVTRWLNQQGFPATAPLDVDQPFEAEDTTVTFWTYYPQDGRPIPGPAALGEILRELHRLPSPPITLQKYEPLAELGRILAEPSSLSAEQHDWLKHRREDLIAGYRELKSTLGEGFAHGDAYPGNTLWDGDRVLLGDWDEIALAPRELDLANTYQGTRFGRTRDQLDAFRDAYGWDVTAWSGFENLRTLRDLHTLGSYIKRADGGDTFATSELQHRVRTLQNGQEEEIWHSAPSL